MGPGVAKAAAATTNTKTTPGNIFASGLSGMVSRHVQQSAASSISGQTGGSITGDSTVEALKDYFTGTSDMDAIPIPAIRENISTARAQRLYKTEVFAVNKYPIRAASYTICIFICIYYVSVYFTRLFCAKESSLWLLPCCTQLAARRIIEQHPYNNIPI